MSGHADAVQRLASYQGGSELSSSVGAASLQAQACFIAPSRAWPLRSYLELGALPTAVPCARLRTRALLAEWDLAKQGELEEVTELLVSELLTNAIATTVEHGLDAPVRLRLSANHAAVLIEVWDGNPSPPPARTTTPPPADAISGGGLFLMDALSADRKSVV